MLQLPMSGSARRRKRAWIRKQRQNEEKHFSIKKQKRILNKRFRRSYQNIVGHVGMQYKKTAGAAQYKYYL